MVCRYERWRPGCGLLRPTDTSGEQNAFRDKVMGSSRCTGIEFLSFYVVVLAINAHAFLFFYLVFLFGVNIFLVFDHRKTHPHVPQLLQSGTCKAGALSFPYFFFLNVSYLCYAPQRFPHLYFTLVVLLFPASFCYLYSCFVFFLSKHQLCFLVSPPFCLSCSLKDG